VGGNAVFISYSHDSREHSDRVQALANALSDLGLKVRLDQFEDSPEHGWPHWCEESLRPEIAKHVLIVCTPTYRDRVLAKVSFDEGRGVYWEGSLVHQYIYDEKGNKRFIPVLIADVPEDSIPIPLRPFTRYRLNEFKLDDQQFEALYRRLTAQPAIVRPLPGARVELPPRQTPRPLTSWQTGASPNNATLSSVKQRVALQSHCHAFQASVPSIARGASSLSSRSGRGRRPRDRSFSGGESR
jgi:hypothetical protein